MLIRTAANEQDVARAFEVYWANDHPGLEDVSTRERDFAHWMHTFTVCPEGFWIAEEETSGKVVGVASAVLRPPQWILTNFYVLPDAQGQGIGKQLIARAYATGADAGVVCERFMVHASEHAAAQGLYMQYGMYPLPYSIYFQGSPLHDLVLAELTVENCPVEEILDTLNYFDQNALGFTRASDHQWWARTGIYFLAKIDDQLVGFFRISAERKIGPLVVSDERWMRPVLDWAIAKQSEISSQPYELFVPGANRIAIAHLIARGCRYLGLNLLLSSHPMDGLARVVFHDTDLL